MDGRQQESGSTTPVIPAQRRHVTRAELRLALVGGRDFPEANPPGPTPPAPRRVLTTVLFTGVVDPTAHAVALAPAPPCGSIGADGTCSTGSRACGRSTG